MTASYLDAVCPIADCGKTLGGSDVIHQKKCLGFVENMSRDAVKPTVKNIHNNNTLTLNKPLPAQMQLKKDSKVMFFVSM